MSAAALDGNITLPGVFGPLKGANGNARITGPCGDTMEFWVKIQDERILRCTFTTDGCSDSVACGTAACTLASGAPESVAFSLEPADVLALIPGLAEESKHCALLAITTLRAAISDYRKNHCPPEACSSCEKKCSSRKETTSPVQTAPNGLSRVKHKIVVLSGKGGVGKSTVAAHLALSLSAKGFNVGLLDADLHGPSIPTLFNLSGTHAEMFGDTIEPVRAGGVKLMSTGFMLEHPDQAVIARGPMKIKIIEQMLKEVNWGDLDYLITDCPPGTGDEPLSVCQLIGSPDGAVIVTTPQEIAAADVRKSVQFCRKIDLPILGILENMSGYTCPKCGETVHLFGKDGGFKTAEKYNIAFLGRIPIDPNVGICGDAGQSFLQKHSGSAAAQAFETAVEQIGVAVRGSFS
ncbi:MAG TPA: P-loop NTPase [Pontiellaceae bacterium]|nr:P-loop NTPase [Pontiellaceae bacterium]HPR82577.1 P-loop NTPase [Pontiellaceae bacterium]